MENILLSETRSSTTFHNTGGTMNRNYEQEPLVAHRSILARLLTLNLQKNDIKCIMQSIKQKRLETNADSKVYKKQTGRKKICIRKII